MSRSRITFYLSQEDAEALETFAKAFSQSKSDLAEMIVKNWIENAQKTLGITTEKPTLKTPKTAQKPSQLKTPSMQTYQSKPFENLTNLFDVDDETDLF